MGHPEVKIRIPPIRANAIPVRSVLEERNIELLISEDEIGLTIWIGDTGVGMDVGEISRIFRRGYSTKGQDRGTGMFLIKNILDASGK